jgi:D-aminopeptidase
MANIKPVSKKKAGGEIAPSVSRPYMPGYGVPKDKKGLLPWSYVAERMAEAKHYWISTVSPEGHPHATPVDGVWIENRLYFGGSPQTRRHRNMEKNPAVCIHLENPVEVVIVHGEAHEMTSVEDELAKKLSEASRAKYGYGPKPEDYQTMKGVFVFQTSWALGWKQFPKDVTRWQFSILALLFIILMLTIDSSAQSKPRARDLGVPFEGTPGKLNAITDVDGVEVGHSTLISGEGKLVVGRGPVRTGVTAVFPRGKNNTEPVFGGWFSLNGNGEMTGTTWLEESGFLEGPVVITNTHSVGVARDAVIEWLVKQAGKTAQAWGLPVVAETWDGWLNDINGFHVKPQHVFAALDGAKAGHVPEGNVGGGTGMICYEFKGGIGTASRKLSERAGSYTIGALVQANFGLRGQLQIAGAPVGREITDQAFRSRETGSIIIVIATDAPLLPHQLKRLTRRAALGLARTGALSGNGSGDIFVAFSTANAKASAPAGVASLTMLPNERMNALFDAVAYAVEEAIINALVAAETMTGVDDHTVIALPQDRLRDVLKKYNRLAPAK